MPNDKKPIDVNSLIRLQDWHERKDGETIPAINACDEWEFTQLMDVRRVMETGEGNMLPGLVFYDYGRGQRMACSFSAKSALAIASSLISNVEHLLPDADLDEVKSLNEGATRALFEGAYSQIESLVLAEHALSARMSRAVGAQLGLMEGAKESRELIAGLVRALELGPGEEREALLDEIAPQLTKALQSDAAG